MTEDPMPSKVEGENWLPKVVLRSHLHMHTKAWHAYLHVHTCTTHAHAHARARTHAYTNQFVVHQQMLAGYC